MIIIKNGILENLNYKISVEEKIKTSKKPM